MIRTTRPDTNDSGIAAGARELDSRINDGIRVQLLWHPHDDHLSVRVNDAKSAEAFELTVGHGQRPLDVFHHPYAYAPQDARATACCGAPHPHG
jgi:hypothetical protein